MSCRFQSALNHGLAGLAARSRPLPFTLLRSLLAALSACCSHCLLLLLPVPLTACRSLCLLLSLPVLLSAATLSAHSLSLSLTYEMPLQDVRLVGSGGCWAGGSSRARSRTLSTLSRARNMPCLAGISHNSSAPLTGRCVPFRSVSSRCTSLLHSVLFFFSCANFPLRITTCISYIHILRILYITR